MTLAPVETRVAILHRATGEESSFPVPFNQFIVGRAEKLELRTPSPQQPIAHLGLPSRYVSAAHVRLQRSGDGTWLVEQLSSHETLLNGSGLKEAEQRVLSADDRLDLAEFSISMVSVDGVVAKEVVSEDARRIAAQLENRIHLALLDAMDLRRADGSLDLDSPVIQQQILDHLDRLVVRELSGLKPATLRQLSRLAVYRLLSFVAISSGAIVISSKSAVLAASRSGHLVRAELDEFLSALAAGLGLELTAKSLSSDLDKIDRNFDQEMTRRELDVGPAILSEIAEYYIRRSILDLIFGLGPLQDLMEMESISEVMVVSRDKIFVEKSGMIEDSRRAFASDDSLVNVIQRIVSPIGRRIDQSSPMVDAHLPDGSRVNAVIPPLALKGPALTIRKFRKAPLTIDDLVGFGALTATMRDFLAACVRGKKNVVVSGGTGSGKTTLLNCLSSFIGQTERVVTIEDTAELQLKQEHVVTLESRPPNMEGRGEVSIRDLVRNALRMRPDRIVVGECRGAEALDMLQAMNTGHDGSMTTGHANAPEDMIRRLETMVLMAVAMPVSAIREQIVSAVDVIVQIQRESGGRRLVTHISEVVALDPETGEVVVEHIFQLPKGSRNAAVQHTGYLPTFTEDLLTQGHMQLGLFLGGSN